MSISRLDRSLVANVIGLSPMQEGILFHYLSTDKTELYFSQLSLNLSGPINLENFKQAWNLVITNNEMLRSVFRWENLKKPIQIILKGQQLVFREYDFTHIIHQERIKKLEEHKKSERAEKFDLAGGPLFKISLCKLDTDNHEMILNNHHILYDGWSMGILLKEFFDIYNKLNHSMPISLVKKTSFREYLNWLQTKDINTSKDYWRTYLKEFRNPTQLPGDYLSKDEINHVDNYLQKLPTGLTGKIENLAKELRVTLSSLLNTAWGILLQKYNDTNEVIFGITVAGRNPDVTGIEDMVGLFINTIPQILRTESNQRVNKLIQKINEELSSRRDHERIGLTEIKSCSNLDSKSNLFDSIVVIENFTFFDELNKNNSLLKIDSYSSFEMPNFDLTVEIVLLEDIEVNFIYNDQIFTKATIRLLHLHYVNILQQIVDNHGQLVSKIELLSSEEKERLLYDFNSTTTDYERKKMIHQLFEEQVIKTPNAVAIEYAGSTLTYTKLNKRANQLARTLQRYGIVQKDVIGVLIERSPEMVCSLLAILKVGAAYLPIDPDYPEERILYMLEDSDVKLILTHNLLEKKISFTALQNFEVNKHLDIMVTRSRSHIEEFDKLPIPDRSLINLRKYKNKIGMASVNNCISLQTTRGCPYKCLYCHKIWSKHHVHRTAENIYAEIKYYYDNGVRNFAVIDDCFNLDTENSSRLFKMIIKNKLKLQIFFPNGLRGDILTPDYIDLMVEAGTRGINLSLETASPRLQKLLMKNLNLDRFKEVVNYIATKHSQIILEMATMHGFPTETEDEAMMTLNFIKDVRWLHFPYIHILKIFPNTEMEEFALANGISKADILKSKDRAFHELPETLPFSKGFTRQYQSNFLNEYFLNKERLRQVIPVQMGILDENALVQKYDAYLPVEIKSIEDVLQFAGIEDLQLPGKIESTGKKSSTVFDRERKPVRTRPNSMKILLLDLSQHFSSHSMMYKVVEQPMGLLYLQTYLNQKFADKIEGRIYKSGIDFESFAELKILVDEYQPDLVGIRTLTFFKEFFHETVALLRQWGVNGPIISGGPYASSDYDTILLDKNIDLIVRGEGEYTMAELIGEILENDLQLPSKNRLEEIAGIAFLNADPTSMKRYDREVLMLEEIQDIMDSADDSNLYPGTVDQLAYVMYTSGTTGKPKGIMVQHSNVNNCIFWMDKEFGISEGDVVVQRTNLTFDPSVWEIFWPLYKGGKVKLLTTEQGRDAQFLIKLLEENNKTDELKIMYCPASLISGMTYLLNSNKEKRALKLPYLFIGAESINMDTIKKFYKYFNGLIVNTYGPTECTINNTYYNLKPDDSHSIVPIGKPIDNNQIYILSKEMQPMPLKQPGEIYIAGESVTCGYINQPERTAEAFVDNLFGSGKLYKTGDVGRWLTDGNIEILGRIDNQVKLRGYRIELSEIENSLLTHEKIQNCAVVIRDIQTDRQDLKVCQQCGITDLYPGVSITEDGICNVCQEQELLMEAINLYFKDLNELKLKITEVNQGTDNKYDCILLYAGGRGAAFALYTLVDMGLKVMTLTYDNGYFPRKDLAYITRVTGELGLDHQFLTHPQTDKILKESIRSANTVCKGCFLTSSALAVEFAKRNNIKVVIGATLSRGQIIENKLLKFYQSGITDAAVIESELLKIQKQTAELEADIYNLLDLDLIKDSSIYDQIKVYDFYRYCDITNEEMNNYLNNRDPYWQNRKDYAIYSTNCPIKQIGDICHLQEKGYHYYGSATSWEKRLGHITLDNLRQDLHCHVTAKSLENFLCKVGYESKMMTEKLETKYIAAYYEAQEELAVTDIRDYLLNRIPEYMLPTYFTWMNTLPLDNNGKINRKVLPKPTTLAGNSAQYIAPRNEIEERLVQVWKNTLGVDKVGIKDSFFALGGNSLSIIKLHEQINKTVDNEVKLMELFKHHTIEMFMTYYDHQYGDSKKSPEEQIEDILARFKNGDIGWEEADNLIAAVEE